MAMHPLYRTDTQLDSFPRFPGLTDQSHLPEIILAHLKVDFPFGLESAAVDIRDDHFYPLEVRVRCTDIHQLISREQAIIATECRG